MTRLQRVEGRGNLIAAELPGLTVQFYYDVFPSGSMLEIHGRVISDDFKTLFAWFQGQTKLTLQTDTFSLTLYLVDDVGSFTATGPPIHHRT